MGLAWLRNKLSALARSGLQGLLGALRRILTKIMLVLQMAPGFSNRLWGGCAALYGVHWAWRGNFTYVIVQTRRGAYLRACMGLYQRLIARAVAACWHLGLRKMVLYGFAQHNCIDTALFCTPARMTV